MNATIQPTDRRDGALARRGAAATGPAQPAAAAQKAGAGGGKRREQQLPEFLAGDIIIFDGKGDFYSSDQQRQALTLQARAYAGVRFGMARGIMHLLDGLINKLVRDDVYLFRRLGRRNRYPVCSGITAITYDRALGYRFGVEPECADPDHIHDWVKAHPDEWERVFCLEEYPHGSRVRAVARST